MTMILKQDHYKKWIAKTDIDLANNKVLTISTSKNSRGVLTTYASVAIQEGAFLTHRMYQDFNILVRESFPKRVTSKVVSDQHTSIDADIIKYQAEYFYQKTI